jgi:hypothetical protein
MKSIEEWPADDLVWVLLIYPGLNELVFGFQEDQQCNPILAFLLGLDSLANTWFSPTSVLYWLSNTIQMYCIGGPIPAILTQYITYQGGIGGPIPYFLLLCIGLPTSGNTNTQYQEQQKIQYTPTSNTCIVPVALLGIHTFF